MSASTASSAAVSDAEVAAWNAQPLGTWTWQELRARLLTDAYERELGMFLSAQAKASAIATIEERRIGGGGIRDLYHQVRNLKGPALRSAMVEWLSKEGPRISQVEVRTRLHIASLEILHVYCTGADCPSKWIFQNVDILKSITHETFFFISPDFIVGGGSVRSRRIQRRVQRTHARINWHAVARL